jgi:hypothetical protein
MFGTRETGASGGPTRGELQDDLMRFEGRFGARLVAAFRPLLEAPDAPMRLQAAQDELGFISAALDIAVGSAPEIDLLDMITLVALGRDAMERRWNVDTCGEAARGVADAFRSSLEDISAVATGVLSSDVEVELRQVILDWQRENPDKNDVAGVRLSAYAKYRPGATDNTGLFALLRGATETADTAVLLGDRALYATQRLPYLVRLHTRVAGREIFEDAQRAARQIVFRAAVSLGGLAVAGTATWLLGRAAYRLVARR